MRVFGARSQNYEKRLLASSCLSVRVSARNISASTGRIFMKFDTFFLLNNQPDAQFFSVDLLIFLTLYMFRAHRAHHQERQIMSIQPLVAVTLCRWL